jgi:hypothetical protein
MFSGLMGQTRFRREIPVGMPGTMEGFAPYKAYPYTNGSTGRAAAYTITPPSAVTANTEYVLTIDDVSIKVNSASMNPVQLMQQFYRQISLDGRAYRLFDMEIASDGVLTLTHRFLNQAASVSAGQLSSNNLVVANTVTPGTELRVPFGVVVGRKPDWLVDNEGVSDAAPISGVDDIILGVTLKQLFEKDRIGPDAVADYPFNVVMTVLKGLGENKGVWIQAVESDIKPSDPVYIQIGTGKVSKNATGNRLFTGASFARSAQVARDGMPMALVYFNL